MLDSADRSTPKLAPPSAGRPTAFDRRAYRYRGGYDVFEQWMLNRHAGIRGLGRVRELPLLARYVTLPYYYSKVPLPRLLPRMLNRDRVLPDFACIGPPLSGADELVPALLRHRSILAPLTQEPGSPIPAQWQPYYPTQRAFDAVAARTGYARTGYFEPRLHDLVMLDAYRAARPDAKVVLVLRDPVERAYAHFQWDLLIGQNQPAFADHLTDYARYIDNAFAMYPTAGASPQIAHSVLTSGIYVDAVRRWINAFGADNVLLLPAEAISRDRGAAARTVFTFLGLPAGAPEVPRQPNRGDRALRCPPRDEETDRRLAEFYAPWNQRLYDLVGTEFRWTRKARV